MPTWYFEWFWGKKATETFFQKHPAGPRIRVTPPPPGISTLITSAPSSPRKSAVAGPKMITERSRTRMPRSASGLSWRSAGSKSRAAQSKYDSLINRPRPRAGLPPPPGSDAEHPGQLHGEPHVALDLQLARHEGHLAVQLAADHVHPVGRGHGEREVRGRGRALLHAALAVGDVDVVGAPALARDVVLDRRLDALRPIRLEPTPHRVEGLLHRGHRSPFSKLPPRCQAPSPRPLVRAPRCEALRARASARATLPGGGSEGGRS